VTARIVVLMALAALVAGCGSSGHQRAAAPPAKQPKPKPAHKPKHERRGHNRPAKLIVTVLDGDRRTRVRDARVRIRGKSAHTNRHGVSQIWAPRRRLAVSVSAPGYSAARVRLDFGPNRYRTVRIYQPGLQWPLYGATAARTQAPEKIHLRPPFHVVWSRGLDRLIEFPAAVDDGFAYIGNAGATVHAISMRSGKFAWVHRTPGNPRMASSPAVTADDVVYHTMSGWVYVLDRTNGHLKWSWNAGSAIESSPIVVGDVDYFGDAAGRVYALDLRSHHVRWSRSLGAKITSSAAISHRRLFIGDYDGHLWALSPGTGSTRWVGTVNGKIYGTPAVAHGRVFVPSSTGNSLSAFTTRGHFLWRDTAGYYVYSSPAVADGVVCWGSYTGEFYGSSAATGRILWRLDTGGPISGAAVIVDGVAYVGSFSHRIIGVNVHTGRRLVTFPHGQYVPVSGNGMRLLFNGFSRVYAVEPRRSH
jgi:outer membrane protein assembly factor BamB